MNGTLDFLDHPGLTLQLRAALGFRFREMGLDGPSPSSLFVTSTANCWDDDRSIERRQRRCFSHRLAFRP